MAKTNNLGGAFTDYLNDPYADKGCITGGVTTGLSWPESGGSNTGFTLPENGTVCIGDDFVMSTKDFKVCMKMLQKMAMKEMPEEFI